MLQDLLRRDIFEYLFLINKNLRSSCNNYKWWPWSSLADVKKNSDANSYQNIFTNRVQIFLNKYIIYQKYE